MSRRWPDARAAILTRILEEVPGLSREERQDLAHEAVRRTVETAGTPDQAPPGRLIAPTAGQTSTRLLLAAPTLLGLAAFFAVVRLAPPMSTTPGLILHVAAFALMLVLIAAANLVTARTTLLPHAWAILRERGVDACLHCGTIGIADARTRSRCRECGATNPPSPTPTPSPAPTQPPSSPSTRSSS